MFIRRLPVVLVGVLVLSALSVGPIAAKRPSPREPAPPSALAERPLTPEEEAAAGAKADAAEAFAASKLREGAHLASLACVTPNATDIGAATDGMTTATCTQPSYTLSVSVRDQERGHYCGPAVGQVISNYSWAMAANRNKYSQNQIATWMQTNVNGGTNAGYLEDGLEAATRNSPRRPANWDWVILNLRDTDGDGQLGDQLHAYVQSNVSGSRMPLAIPVKPHDADSQYRLASWPRPVASVGHWIAAFGWYAYWSNTDIPHIAYTDSSRDEGGSTGKFWDPTRHLAALIREHTGRIVW